MRTLSKIIKYQLNDVFRSKWVVVYTAFFFLISYGLLTFSHDSSKVLVSLLNVIIIVIPLISIVFGTIFLYNNKNAITFLLSQPVERKLLYIGLYLGLIIPLTLSFIIGTIIPVIIFFKVFNENFTTFLLLIGAGIFLTMIFGGIAFLISTYNEDRLRGLGISIFTWLLLSALYDGIVLLLLQVFQEYPLEKVSIALSILNPVDLARIIVILKFDVSALMGYTGAVFQNFFSGGLGFIIASSALLIWIILPLFMGMRKFIKKDF
ncbi:MAG: ABC transporter permease subunit [Melioribacteraceae bacterium]|nr:ABC transporter permease subunit [Melioribacteraceae bacterium]MCF8354969.1 ABC transporter permease subunit [Melioribacteraceae bacterium]MCF8394014.1 ABC transporter permease subunit [Melioribacteraceae bacterium]MCF8419783.1 ABC transporter permease subunit [Melioribacteraceae bacterium]